ncbi:MAG: glycosyltransferase family 4 protein [Thermoleophilaceae bacterium]
MSDPPDQRRAVVVSAVMPYPATGGGHKRTLRLLEAIERSGGSPHLLTSDPGQPGGAEELRRRGWTVEVVDEPPPGRLARARQHVRRLPSPYLAGVAARLRALAPSAAFVQIEHTQSAYYTGALEGVRWILSLHNVDSQMLESVARGQRPLSLGWARAWNRTLALRAVERRAVPRATAVLCVSERDRDHFSGRAERLLLVPNGVDDEFFEVPEGLPEGEDVIFFGQFDYPPNALGVERFLREGWPALARERPGARLRLVGQRMSPELARLAAGGERVEVVGFVDDVTQELAASRLVIVPLWQGGGTRLKVLESLAACRPVVGTPLGVEGIGFEHDRHGLVAEEPRSLAAAAAELLGDAERSARLALSGRGLAESYRWVRATEPAQELYRSWLDSGPPEGVERLSR